MATEYTPNYNLDLYASADKPNLRDQYNAAMGKIDAQMKVNADGVTNANANVGTLQTQMSQANANIDNLQESMSALETQVGEATETADSALQKANSNETSITALTSRVTAVESKAAQTEAETNENTSNISSLTSSLDTLSATVSEKAPINHASTGTQYGTGNATSYGHVKLTDTPSASNASQGAALTPNGCNTAIASFAEKYTIEDFDLIDISSDYADSRIKSGHIKIQTKNGSGVISLTDLKIDNSSGGIAFVPIVNLDEYGFTFGSNDIDMRSVVISNDAATVRYVRLVYNTSEQRPQLQLSMPNNANLTFEGQVAFVYNKSIVGTMAENGIASPSKMIMG